jgi:hypothetical protein
VSSHRNEAPAPLTWYDSAGALQTCLMIGETTDGANCLDVLEAPQVVTLAMPHLQRDRTVTSGWWPESGVKGTGVVPVHGDVR